MGWGLGLPPRTGQAGPGPGAVSAGLLPGKFTSQGQEAGAVRQGRVTLECGEGSRISFSGELKDLSIWNSSTLK